MLSMICSDIGTKLDYRYFLKLRVLARYYHIFKYPYNAVNKFNNWFKGLLRSRKVSDIYCIFKFNFGTLHVSYYLGDLVVQVCLLHNFFFIILKIKNL